MTLTFAALQVMTVDDIAAEAGVSKGSPYVYFESKEALFRALYDSWDCGLADPIEDAVGRLDAGEARSPRRVLEAVITAVGVPVSEEADLCRVLIEARTQAAYVDAVAETVRASQTERQAKLRRLIEAGIACGDWAARHRPRGPWAPDGGHPIRADGRVAPAFGLVLVAGDGSGAGERLVVARRRRRIEMKQQRVDSWWAQWTCVGGTCAPPVAAPRNRFERLLDAYTSITAPFIHGCFVFVTVAAAAIATSALGPVTGLLVEAVFFLVAGSYCLANFARCGEAHCIVTGLGWSALAIGSAAAARAGRDARGGAWVAFLVVAVAGHAFEAAWKAARGTNELRLAPIGSGSARRRTNTRTG